MKPETEKALKRARSAKASAPVGEGLNLGEVASLARALCEAEDDVEAMELRLKDLKERERRLREEDLPGAMQELGLEKITLATGEVISTKLDVYCQIPVAQKGDAYKWLDEHGHGGLIKTELSLNFNRDEREQAKELSMALQNQGLMPEMSESVAPQTLKAWLKDQLANAVDKDHAVPLDLFGARPVTVAKVKRK